MLPENENTAPNRPDQDSETPMSILERRLAEIAKARQNPDEPNADATPDNSSAAPSSEQAPTPQPAEVNTAVPSAADIPPPAALTAPEASVAAEAPRAAEAPAPLAAGTTLTSSEQRAEAHYGNSGPGAVAAAAEAGTSFAPSANQAAPAGNAAASPAEQMPEAVREPEQQLDQASAIESAAAPIGSLPTSNNQSAAEAAKALAADEHEEDYVPETPAPDFSKLDLASQGSYLLSLLQRPDARQNRRQILDLHRQYEQGINTERNAARQRFTEAGNDAEAFAFTGPDGYAELTRGIQEYREARVRDAKQEDEQRLQNLTRKQELLGQLRLLVESAETKDSSARIKSLQAEWKAIGPVPQQQAQELWNSYHALLDIYYNNRGLFFEMKELDRRRNLEAKEALIQRADALSQQPSINKALTELRQLHEEWKTVGPVPNEMREPLWQRFLQASEKVHERKRTFLDARSAQENANLQRKQELLAQIIPFSEFRTERVNEWRAKTDELQALKEQWDAAGLVPRSQAETMNKQFWAAYKGFFQHKNQFFKALDEEKARNLKAKVALCEQAEAALENPNWEEARETVIRVQKEWKGIGRVPEKQSDKIWNRFRTACDAFFERKHQETRQREQHVQQLSQEQAARLDRIASHVATLSSDNPGTPEGLQALVEEWSQSDAQSNNKRGGTAQAEEKFLDLMGKYINTLPGLTYAEREDQLFQLQVQRMKSNPDAQQLLYRKEQGLRREINELENDVATLQTNLDFFARSKNAGQLREEYQGRIDETKVRIERLKRQLRVVRS
ncbi:DUF349 domain-containing protein [Hymenobacter oligotrophus]|uniref:DUF349 domain-containing protein n=1 Tax=Hymenobacter oligotrophus TaxID=2319843 RepID=A0A3B7RQ95_9BACT|nr:DUF349 domain-containing protein [Hymenobacter oligotrophus]AYA36347.1 DUF349 domain-containing protein [Hymenobacter oligotrophus]